MGTDGTARELTHVLGIWSIDVADMFPSADVRIVYPATARDVSDVDLGDGG